MASAASCQFGIGGRSGGIGRARAGGPRARRKRARVDRARADASMFGEHGLALARRGVCGKSRRERNWGASMGG